MSVIETFEFQACKPPTFTKHDYCTKTLMYPDYVNTTTYSGTLAWCTCPTKDSAKYRMTIEKIDD